jgi:hypothetical protein
MELSRVDMSTGRSPDHDLHLSKSLVVRGMQCHKALYLYKYHAELRGEIPRDRQRLFQGGFEVGKAARKLFPGGTEIPYEGLSLPEQLQRTRDEIAKGTKTIYEAAFGYDGDFVKVDILHKGRGGWQIHEVKASTELKDVHLNDTAIQHCVVSGSGLSVSKATVVHINSDYVRIGDVEVYQLFRTRDVTAEVRAKQGFVKDQLGQLRTMLQGDMPQTDIGEHCSDPYECEFVEHCWRHIPEDSVFSLKGRGVDKFDLYRQGIVSLGDVPLDTLNARQRMQVESFLGQAEVVDKASLREFIDTLWNPLCFLDFETFNTPIPVFAGVSPYQHVPYQYSLHLRDNGRSKLKHHDFIACLDRDYREDLLVSLLSQIAEGACVLAYNSPFEMQVLSGLAEQFPQYYGHIRGVIRNMRDLAAPFRSRAVYHHRMNGSYSLKAVLSAVVLGLSYEGLEVSDGAMAMDAYFAMCEAANPAEKARLGKALLEYCRLDTLAMGRILERLSELCA